MTKYLRSGETAPRPFWGELILPFSQSGGQLLFHALRKLYPRTSVLIITNLSFAKWPFVGGDA
ncbi:ATP-binding protein, partial [Azospirillum brasilense]|uniref:ATP-binding protein n=1 Tax=Azospirillum brasilense TaxID=192 RepID=UPI003D7EBABB